MSEVKKKGKSKVGKIVWLSLLTLIVLGVAAIFWASFENEFYTTREVQLQEASVVSKDTDDDGPYVEMNVNGVSHTLFSQVTDDFYSKISPGQQVGVLVGTVDTYRARESINKKLLTVTFLSTDYEVLALYPSLADAQTESKPATFTMPGTLVQRAKSQDGRYFFLMDAGGKRQMAEVNQEYYNRYVPQTTAPSSFELQFEGFGEYSRFDKIVKP